MKALVEIIMIWGTVLAVVLAVFLLNLWLVHLVELLVGTKRHMGNHRSGCRDGNCVDF